MRTACERRSTGTWPRWPRPTRTPWAELYAEDGFFEDPAGGRRHTGRDEVRQHFAAAIEGPRDVTLLSLAVVGREAAMLFRAVSADGSATEVFDVMSFDDDARITATRAYWPAERPP